MTDSEALIYGMLMQQSNVDKLVQSGLKDLVLDDLWFKCVECKNQHHCDNMLLLGCSLDSGGKLKPGVAAQSVRHFFEPTTDGVSGLSKPLAQHDGISLRCVQCAAAMWDVEIETVTGETPEGWRNQ